MLLFIPVAYRVYQGIIRTGEYVGHAYMFKSVSCHLQDFLLDVLNGV